MLLSAVIYATTAGLSPVAVAVVTYTFDAGLYLAEIGLVNRYISIDPTAANRFNVVGLVGVSPSLALLAVLNKGTDASRPSSWFPGWCARHTEVRLARVRLAAGWFRGGDDVLFGATGP
jgi:hypothetical protein